MQIGAVVTPQGCTFTVWAPVAKQVELHLFGPPVQDIALAQTENGYWSVTLQGVGQGACYFLRVDGGELRPDPASRAQPRGVHGPSMVVDHSRFVWSTAAGPARKLDDYVMYELHIGTFTAKGTFASAVERIAALVDLGVTAVEIMPVAAFPGERNWGYDGVYPFAVQHSCGGAEGLQQFVDACHRNNLSVVLDVVYNHFGPEGNYLRDFGPWFTDRYRTPWGESLNFDGPFSDGVCAVLIANACYWLQEFRIDALRLDAVHAICDMGAHPFLARLAETVEATFATSPVPRYLIAESDLNDVRVLRPRQEGGLGLHAQWSDDFHHALHALLTGERRGYYADFGTVDHLERVLAQGFCYSGQYAPSRRRRHGNDASSFHTARFVVCSQNHDQIGNRMLGERLGTLCPEERARLAAALVLLSPYIPLLFMGEEHGEEQPFLYFADHGDEGLRDAVRNGRKEEFAAFHDQGEPPDPFDRQTFEQSRPDWERQARAPGSHLYRLYRDLIRVRTTCPAIGPAPREQVRVTRQEGNACIHVHYYRECGAAWCLFNAGPDAAFARQTGQGEWVKRLDSLSYDDTLGQTPLPQRLSSGSPLTIPPWGFAVYERDGSDSPS